MIIWLASYPKSGNTWVRAMIASLIFTNDGKFDFELLKNIQQFPVTSQFKTLTKNYDNLDEIKKHWIDAQTLINLNNRINFLKTHNINCKINNFYFTNKENTLATIYIIRDPRNLVSSIANHYSKTIEESKNFILSPRITIGHNKFKNNNQKVVPVLLGTWGEHYKFWKANNENFLLIKYENLIKNTELELNRIINFLKKFMSIQTDLNKNKNIIQTTSFENLGYLEDEGKFDENAFDSKQKKKFFYLGPKNNWKDNLDNKTIDEIEKNFSNEMKSLGYI